MSISKTIMKPLYSYIYRTNSFVMKHPVFILAMAAGALCVNNNLAAQTNGYFVKEKNIHKEYKNVHSTDTFSIINSYGNTEINTWDKDEVAVDIIATSFSKTEALAQELLDSVVINETTGPNKIRTGVSKHGPKRANAADNAINGIAVPGRTEEWESNTICKVTVPNNITLDIYHYFGNLSISDFAGVVNAYIMQGTINAKHLSGPSNKIFVNRSNGKMNKISAIDAGELKCSNSCCALTIDKPVDNTKVLLNGWAPVTISSHKRSRIIK